MNFPILGQKDYHMSLVRIGLSDCALDGWQQPS